MNTFEDADRFAADVHKTQTRKFGTDKGKSYIIHPRRMAARTDDPIKKQAAVLHDTLEDGYLDNPRRKVTVDDLREAGFAPEVIEIVEDLTHYQGETYFDFIMRVMKKPRSAAVKILDIEDNMANLEEGSLKDKYRFALFVLKNADKFSC